MDYRPREIEQKWKKHWDDHHVYRVNNRSDKPKFYVLDMFPYPSGAGLHVGHPLGYIASDIFSRYKRLKGFNVLHPMGYDAFGLPAEQYAIQTGVHPAVSTAANVANFREQLDKLGFSYDWSREVSTADPGFYKWTQWIFLQLFDHWYDRSAQQAQPVSDLIARFETSGAGGIDAACSEELSFSAADWKAMTPKEKNDVLMNYRLAYRRETFVNWCEELGTVLANDEVKDGVSVRGGHPVERKAMLQWSLRITAYAERLLGDLDTLDWSEAMKKMQTNWIGRSTGAQLFFDVAGSDHKIEIFTTRPDTIFGATYMVLAPEHDLVEALTTPECREDVESYLEYVKSRSERERMSDVKAVTGAFLGSYAVNPFTNEQIPVWIGEYVLKDYGTGAIMAVPADDERDMRFAHKFKLPIVEIIDKSMYPGATIEDKVGKMINSGPYNGMEVAEAIEAISARIDEMGIGKRRINFKLRDAIYSRQRYWGEPFPIIYDKDGVAYPLPLDELPLELPELADFKPTSGNKSPLARNESWVNLPDGYTRETDTMPGFAGSSWYFLRYMDARNNEAFAGQDAVNYWKDVDLYIGGTEHAVGHLMYSRFWHKFLYDKGLVPTIEPFRKLVNQGMIQGVILNVHMAHFIKESDWADDVRYADRTTGMEYAVWIDANTQPGDKFNHPQYGPGFLAFDSENPVTRKTPLSLGKEAAVDGKTRYRLYKETVDNLDGRHDQNAAYLASVLDQGSAFAWKTDENGAEYLELTWEVGKMSKSLYNTINPDDIVERYGADCFRMYEMFLGPIEQGKPWNTSGIDGVFRFLRKFWGLYFNGQGTLSLSGETPSKDELKVLHTAIKKVTEDIERLSFNTCVSAFMMATNDLGRLDCSKRAVLEPMVILIAPFAPHLAEELWRLMGNSGTVHDATYPEFDEQYLVEDTVTYPVAINGKTRGTVDFPADASREELEKIAPTLEVVRKYLEGAAVKKVIVVPGRMINLVV
ncbi:MAG: leucine--tRNA ligase [Lewinellaceae bacterium]|nr:leucine--tRNA ligase [Lewinellaceae bacterium]